jgi:hypothetical protein
MDIPLFNKLLESQPKFNQRLVQGLAVHEMQFVERYVEERILKVAAQEFPPTLVLKPMRRATPEEEFNEIANMQKRAVKRATFETAPSDFYMVFLNFEFEGQPLDPIPVMLPYVRPGGLIQVRGSWFHITPVVADRSISIDMNSIFMRFNKLMMNLYRHAHHYMLDGKRQSPYMVHGKLHNNQIKSRGRGRTLLSNMKTILPHYLFAKFGLKQAFALYCNAEVEVGYPLDITPERYPPDQWVICNSIYTGQQVRGGRPQLGTPVYMAVKRNADTPTGISHQTDVFVGAFFYIADHFPTRVVPDDVDEERLWVVLLGELLFGSSHSFGKLAEDVYNHLRSLDTGLDQESQANLRSTGIYCSNMYDFLADMSFTFSQRITQGMKTVPSMYGKRLTILRYVLNDLRTGVNRFMFEMTKNANNRKRPLQRKDVMNALRRYIKWDIVYRISGSLHGEVTSVSAPGDNMLFKITSQAVLQTDSSGPRSRAGGGRSGVESNKLLHVSVAETASYNTMSKSEPSGRNKLNPYVTFDGEGVLQQSPEMAPLLDRVQAMIQR